MIKTIGAATIAPPKKPRSGSLKTGRRPKTYYTINSGPNQAFALLLDDDSRMSMVGFRQWDDALFIGRMIETHYDVMHEWPDIRQPGALTLPAPQKNDVLHHLYIQKWSDSELQMTCTRNFMDMMTVDDITKGDTLGSHAFSGSVMRLSADMDFYRTRLDELLDR